ncbi:hypothetical protein DFQ27_003671 [Actinomortierella ambigua]|uniref:Uncharacterized protein n=1 Tax=Actinomortierella ambigua TaxID=1343610 RepID=A0A9P6U566_9FUNG|nr:hypothetical protein DFQ27_003671 [Actinomortierella ambigua]
MSDWPEAGIQHPLRYEDHATIIIGNDQQPRGVPIPGDKVHSTAELVNDMQRLIESTMHFQYNPGAYHGTFMSQLCSSDMCSVKPLSAPAVEVIPVTRLTSDLLCILTTCNLVVSDAATVSTVDPTFPYANSKPFQAGVKFAFHDLYGFSDWREQPMPINYQFALKKGDKGYVAMVNAQISEKVELTGEICDSDSEGCPIPHDPKPVTVGYHQAVIMNRQINEPISIVAFVYI